MYAVTEANRMVEFPDAGDVGVVRIVPSLVTLATHLAVLGSTVCRLRAGHSLLTMSDAKWDNRYQLRTDLFAD